MCGGVHLLVYGVRVLVYMCSLCIWGHMLVWVICISMWCACISVCVFPVYMKAHRCTCNYACICITQWFYILDCSSSCVLWQGLSWPCELLDMTSLATSLPVEMPFSHLCSVSPGISDGLQSTRRHLHKSWGSKLSRSCLHSKCVPTEPSPLFLELFFFSSSSSYIIL